MSTPVPPPPPPPPPPPGPPPGGGAAVAPAPQVPADALERGLVALGVRRSFGAVRAVDGIDLVARPGAVTALVGPNGSGKTTLLLMLAGLLHPDSGMIRVAGQDPTAGPAARALTGWMPDFFGTWDSLTAREVLTTVGAAYRMGPDQAALRAAQLLDLVHLSELADRPAHVLSRGQKQRLGLARALVHDPQVLLLDEPASGLDPRSRVDLRVLVRDLARHGRTVLVSSHVLAELDEMVDDAVFISSGRTVAAESMARAASARRPWRLRALSGDGLRRWLADTGTPWRPDAEAEPVAAPDGFAPPPVAGTAVPAVPGSVLVDLDGEEGAARLLRAAVTAGVPVTSLAPAAGALEAAYLALDEERR